MIKNRILEKIIVILIIALIVIGVGLVSYHFFNRTVVIVSTCLSAAYLLNITLGLYILSSQQRNDRSKKTWLFAFLILPLIAIILFLLFGQQAFKEKKKKDIIQKRKILFEYEDYSFIHDFMSYNYSSEPGLELFAKVVKYSYNLYGTPIYNDAQIRLIEEPTMMFEETIKLIRKAEKSIYLQYFIIEDGSWLDVIVNELIKKAKEGIKIYLLYDWVGSLFKFKKETKLKLIANGIKVAKFHAKADLKMRSTINFRNHRKYLIVDGKYAITGGSNIGDSYLNIDRSIGHWMDLNYFVSGGIVHTMLLEFIHDWYYYVPRSHKLDFDQLINEMGIDQFEIKDYSTPSINDIKESTMTCLMHTGPNQSTNSLIEILLMAFANAKKSISIFTPYLFPTEELIVALCSAANAGIDVQIMLPGRTDSSPFILSMNRLSYKKLISSGVKIYEYSGFMHTKAVLIDNETALLGSYNLDNRALVINFESLLFIYSKKTNHQIQKLFLEMTNNSKLVTLQDLEQKPTARQVVETIFVNIFQPLL